VVELTQTDTDQYVELRCGDTTVVRLKETPATGFLWAVENDAENVIVVKSSDFALDPTSGVGGGGQRVMIFEARQDGSARLHFKLWRAWEGDESVKNQFDIFITVQN